MSIRKKILLGYGLLSLVVALLLSYLNFLDSKKRLESHLGERLKHIAVTSSLMVPFKKHYAVEKLYLQQSSNLVESDEFKEIQSTLRNIQVANELKSDIYTVIAPKWAPGKMIFVTMSAEKTYVGNAMDINKGVERIYKTRKASFSQLYKDSEGEWISAYAPILDKEGNVSAVIEVDYNADKEVAVAVEKMLHDFLISLGIALGISLLLSLIVGEVSIRPITKMTEEASSIFEKNFELKISGEENKGAVGVLAKTFNGLIDEVRNYTNHLEEMVDTRTKEVEKLKDELVAKAFNEGQAENAIHILHNLGNLLTPLMSEVSDDGIVKRLEKSRKALDLLKKLLSEEKAVDIKLLQLTKALINDLDGTLESYRSGREVLQEIGGEISELVHKQQQYVNLKEESIERVGFSSIIVDVVKLYEKDLRESGIELDISSKVEGHVCVEKNRFFTVISELVKNSIEAVNKKSDSKKLIQIKVLDQGGQVELSLSDNGVGISADNLVNIFRRGFSTKEENSGFGLHECANLISSYNGSLNCTSEGEGKGTKISLILPKAS